MKTITRRSFLAGSAATALLVGRPATSLGAPRTRGSDPALALEVGLVAATLGSHQSHRAGAKDGIAFLDIPRILRDELDMRVLDWNTMNFPSFEPSLLEKLRAKAGEAGVTMTNLKMNQRGLEIGSADPETRRHGIDEYKKSIDHAALMGLRWVRPLPIAKKPSLDLLVDSLRELADYAREHGVTLLIENFGWMQSDPNSVAKLIAAVERDLPASPDTGNWNSNEIRYKGLAITFPLAATCDFKAKTLGPDGEHQAYDLERCFRIGWDAGFRGPWCIEHGNRDRATLYRELALVRDMLRGWMKEASPA